MFCRIMSTRRLLPWCNMSRSFFLTILLELHFSIHLLFFSSVFCCGVFAMLRWLWLRSELHQGTRPGCRFPISQICSSLARPGCGYQICQVRTALARQGRHCTAHARPTRGPICGICPPGPRPRCGDLIRQVCAFPARPGCCCQICQVCTALARQGHNCKATGRPGCGCRIFLSCRICPRPGCGDLICQVCSTICEIEICTSGSRPGCRHPICSSLARKGGSQICQVCTALAGQGRPGFQIRLSCRVCPRSGCGDLIFQVCSSLAPPSCEI
jgi:hypothetical protein